MPQAQDEAGNIWETDAQGNAVRLVRAGGQPSVAGGIVTKQADPGRPYEAPKAAADLAIAQGKVAMSPAEIRIAEANARKANAEAKTAETTAAQGNTGKGLSPEVRKEAIGGYQSALALERQIDEIKNANAAGPGSTKGLMGLLDYLPGPANSTFNDASNAARAYGGPVLGFTASQLNTEKEQQRAIGPYIPSSSDFDGQAEAKIKRLQGLVQQAKDRSVQVLGGIPDINGKITPLQERNPIPGVNPPTGPDLWGNAGTNLGGPSAGLATGGRFSTPEDIAFQRQAEERFNKGATFDELNALSVQAGRGPVPEAWRGFVEQRDKGQKFGPGAPPESGVLGGVSSALSSIAGPDVAAGVVNAGNSVFPLALLPGAADNTNDIIGELQKQSPGSSLTGSLIGGIPGAALAELGAARYLPGAAARFAPQIADAGYGAVQGFGNAQDGEGAMQAAVGGVAGLLGGEAGRRVVGGFGSAVRGVDNASVQELRRRGVEMTGGQVLGGTAKQIEDQLTSYPIIGGIIKSRRDEGLTDFNRAMFREGSGGAPIQNIGERGAEQLDDVVTQAYAPLNRFSAQADNNLVGDLTAAADRGQAIPGRADDFDYVVRSRVGPNFDMANGGVMSGANYQDAIRGLRTAGAEQGPAAMHPGDFSGALGDVEGALTGMFQRQAPEATDILNNANGIYRNQSIIDEAVKAARNQRGPDGDALVMPSQLNAASVNNTNRFGGRSRAATTDRPFYDLATAGQEVLPSKTGDSGTAGRLALLAGLGLAGGGGAGVGASDGGGIEGAASGGGAGLLTLAALATLGGSRPAQQALTRALTARPEWARTLGTRLQNSPVIGGVLGRDAGYQLLGGN